MGNFKRAVKVSRAARSAEHRRDQLSACSRFYTAREKRDNKNLACRQMDVVAMDDNDVAN